MIQTRNRRFPFSKGDVVLAKYQHEIFYAKILKIYYVKKYAKLIFDDASIERIPFHHIYDVNETTSAIICVVCKGENSHPGNDIVLCDQCNVGFHQICHEPAIPSDVLKPDIPWECCYCCNQLKNPHVESNPFVGDKGEDVNQKEVHGGESDPFGNNKKTDDTDNTNSIINKRFQETIKVENINDVNNSMKTKPVTMNCKQSIPTKRLYEEETCIMEKDEEQSMDRRDFTKKDNKATKDFKEESKGITRLSDEGNTEEVLEDDEVFGTLEENIDYGEQIVIARSDRTSSEDSDEDVIVDVESNDDYVINTDQDDNFRNVCDFKSIDFLERYLHNKRSLTSFECHKQKDNTYNSCRVNTIVTQSLDSTCRLSTTVYPSESTFHTTSKNQTKIHKPTLYERCFSDITSYHSKKTRIFHPYHREHSSNFGDGMGFDYAYYHLYLSEKNLTESVYKKTGSLQPSVVKETSYNTNSCQKGNVYPNVVCSDT